MWRSWLVYYGSITNPEILAISLGLCGNIYLWKFYFLCFSFSLSQLFNPIEFLEDIVVEHEYVECTASTIQALVLFKKLHPGHRMEEIDSSIRNGISYIENTQLPDGSWYVRSSTNSLDMFELLQINYMMNLCHRYGSWGICFIYGTWFALGGLPAVGKTYHNCPTVRKAVDFLLRTQKNNGGWGESYLSCPNKVMFQNGLCCKPFYSSSFNN